MNGTRFSDEPPDDDGQHDPTRCACGFDLAMFDVGPDERELLCPHCDRRMIAGDLRGDDVDEDLTPSERATLDELRAVRLQLEAQVPESGEVPF